MKCEINNRLFFTHSHETAVAVADALKKATERDCRIEGPTHSANENERWVVTLEPVLTAPTCADLEEFIQNAFEQNAEMHCHEADDGEIDLREAKCEALAVHNGFKISLPLAGKAFTVTIEETPL